MHIFYQYNVRVGVTGHCMRQKFMCFQIRHESSAFSVRQKFIRVFLSATNQAHFPCNRSSYVFSSRPWIKGVFRATEVHLDFQISGVPSHFTLPTYIESYTNDNVNRVFPVCNEQCVRDITFIINLTWMTLTVIHPPTVFWFRLQSLQTRWNQMYFNATAKVHPCFHIRH